MFNVIPDRVVMKGTVRAVTDDWMARLRQRIEEVRTPKQLLERSHAFKMWKRKQPQAQALVSG